MNIFEKFNYLQDRVHETYIKIHDGLRMYVKAHAKEICPDYPDSVGFHYHYPDEDGLVLVVSVGYGEESHQVEIRVKIEDVLEYIE